MKKSLLALALFSVVSNSLDAAWTVPPPPSASVGAAISVSAVGTAYSGYSPSTAMTMWWQNPAGTWTSSDIGGGVNFGSMSGNQSITLDAVGTWTFYVTRRSSGGTPSPSDEKISSVNTTQVTGASVNFIFASLSQTYDGSSKTATITVDPSNATYTSDLTKGPDVGSYTVSATANGNFSGSNSATLTINPAGTSFWLSGTSFTYNGGWQGPSIVASSGNATYSPGGTLSAVNVGSYNGTATAYGNYTGSNTALGWTISPASATFSLSATSFTYNGGAQGPSILPSPSAATYSPGGALSAVNAGTYTASASAYGNYTGSNGALTWTINKANQTISFGALGNKTYGDAPYAVSASASSGLPVSFSIVSGPATVSFGTVTITGVGTVTVRASQAGNGAPPNNTIYNYNAAADVDRSFVVSPQPVTFALNTASFTYTGGAQGPSIVTTPAGGVTYTTGGTLSATTAGSYTATATANGNYTGTNNSLTWTINKAAQATVTITSVASMTYGNAYTATASGGTGTGAIVWSLGTGSTAASAAINSSSGAITANSTGTVVIRAQRATDTNYNASAWTADFTVTVGARPITVTLAGSKSYNGNTTATGASASITAGSLAAGDSIGYAYAATSSANTGTYTGLTTAAVTNAAAPTTRTGSYSITYNGSYAINQANVTAATLTPKVYTGSSQSPSAVSSTNPAGATVSVSAPTQTNVGTYTTATVTGTGNFTGTLSNVSWSITAAAQAPVTIDPPATVSYGTPYTAHAAGGSGNGAIVWALGAGSTASGAAINSSSGAITANSTGTVVIKAQRAADANYSVSAWTADFPVTVTARPITVTFSGSKVYDGTTTVTGASAAISSGSLAAGDSIGYAFAATSSASPGSYTGLTIPTITNASAPTTRTGSYAITYSGNYIIRAVITAARIVPLNYIGTAQSPSAVSSTTPAGATVSVSAPAQTNAGTYPTATVTGTGDFAGTLYNVPWSISQVAQDPLVINSNDWMIYLSPYTATTTGGSGTGEVVWDLGTGSTAPGAAINSSTGAVSSNGTGTVVIRAKKLGDINYPESGWTSDFEITVHKADQTITFNNPGPQTYLTSLTFAAAASSGLPVSYQITAGPANVTDNVVTFASIGTVTVEALQGGDSNFNAAPPVSQTFVVNPAPTTFALSATSFTYNGIAQGPTVVPTPSGATFTTGGTLSAIAPGNYIGTATAFGNYTGSNNALSWTLNKATPAAVFQNPRARGTQTPTTYTVQAGDLNASFLPAGAGATPSGPVTYSIIAASGTGASPSSGAVTAGTVFTIGSYTIRASYPGDANYNATSVDAVWNIVLDVDGDGIPGYIEVLLGLDPNVPNNQNDGSNQTQLEIHRPKQ